MIPVTFYTLPMIDGTHEHVIVSMRQYLSARNDGQTHNLQNFQPRLSPFRLEITYQNKHWTDYFSAFNYCTFSADGMEWGCFVRDHEFTTTKTLSVTLVPDWWYMFIDSDIYGETFSGSFALSGNVEQSTLFRQAGGIFHTSADTHFRIPAIFGGDSKITPITRTDAPLFRVCANISVGTEYSLSGDTNGILGPKVTKTYWIMFDRVDDGLLTGAIMEFLAGSDRLITSGGITHGILSINNVQVVPQELLPDSAIHGSAAFAGTLMNGDQSKAVLYMMASWADNFYTTWTVPTSIMGANTAGKQNRAIFFGNYSKLVQLRDYDGKTPVQLRGAFAGDHLEILLNYAGEIVNMTDGTMLPYTYNNAAGIAATNRTNDVLRGISAGVMVAGAVASTVATGGATAAMIPGAAIGATSSLSGITGRQSEIRSSSAPGFYRNLREFSVLWYAYAAPVNNRARAWDFLCYGLSGSYAVVDSQIMTILHDAADIVGGYEFIKFSEGLQVRVRPHIVDGEALAPVPGPETIRDVRDALVRGISFWLPGGSDPWSDTWGHVGDYSALSGRLG